MIKKIICIAVMLVSICILPLNAYTASGTLVASTPVITSSTDGTVSAYSYVKNNSLGTKNVKMVLYDGSDTVVSIEKSLKSDELTKLTLKGLSGDSVSLYDMTSNTQIVTLNINTDIEFEITSSSVTDNFSPFNELKFDFSRQLSEETLSYVSVKCNGIEVENKQIIYEENEDFTSQIVIKHNGEALNYSSHYEIIFPSEVTDILGNSLKKTVYAFDTCKPEEEFQVYQKSVNVAQAGLGGFSVLCDFERGVRKVAFSRKTYNPKIEADTAFVTSSYAKIIDPDGELLYIYDFTVMPNGEKTVVKEIDFNKEGIYHFQFISGRSDDEIAIGIQTPKNWGVRGECILGVNETTPLTSYIYTSEKTQSVAISSSKGKSISLYDTQDNLICNSSSLNTAFTKTGFETAVESDKVYKLVLSDDFYGGLIVDRCPSLMCPTEEMALNLKGGWIETEGIICQGVIQKSAREEALRLLSKKNLDIIFEKPDTVPQNIENPVAEALLFSSYGMVAPIGDQAKRQVLDPQSPYLGRFLTKDEYNAGGIATSWETGDFNPWGSVAFSGAIATPAQLNYLYENEGLINRSAISILGTLTAMSEDFIIREGNNANAYPTTHGNFYFSWMANGYAEIRDYLDDETVRVIDNALGVLCDKQGNYRGMKVTNQWMFSTTAIDAVYRATGIKRYGEALQRHIDGLYTAAHTAAQGQSSAGYFIEGYGCDGSYHNLNQQLIYTMYKAQKKSNYRIDDVVNKLQKIINKNVEFNSLFWTTQPEKTEAVGPNCFTARTTGVYGGIDHISYPVIADENPLAKRRFEIMNMPASGAGPAGTFAYYINNDEWAMRLINSSFKKYENTTLGYSANGFSYWYDALKNRDNCQSTLLPCEQEAGIWEKDGIIAVKHKGLYFNIFYTFPENPDMPGSSTMGGGITLMHSEGTGSAILSNKNYSEADGTKTYNLVKSEDDIMATCVYGKNISGDIVYNGKEKATFQWVEKDKIFEITEKISDTDATLTWRYELLDNSVKLTVTVDGDNTLKDLYLNIPVVKSENKASVASDGKAVYYLYNDNAVCVSSEEESSVSIRGDTTRFRVKLDENNSATVTFNSQNTDEMEILNHTEADGVVSFDLRNNQSLSKNCDVYFVSYTKEGVVHQVEKDEISVEGHTTKDIENKLNKKADGYIKIFIWTGGLKPLVSK